MSGFDPIVAYAAEVTNENWRSVFQFVNRMLRSGDRVLIATESQAFSPGTFIFPVSSEFDPWLSGNDVNRTLVSAAAGASIDLVPLTSDIRLIARAASATRIGLYGGGGAPFNHAGILATCGFQVDFLNDADVRAGRLAEVDVFVMPGGGERAMFGQIEPLGEAGCLAIAEFVRAGGMYIGCCAGSYDCIVNDDAFLSECPAQRCLQLINAAPWKGENAVGFLGLQSPGVGVVRVKNTQPGHPVMYGMAEEFSIVHYNGPVLDPLAQRTVDGASNAVGLASFTGWTEQFTPAERFNGFHASGEPTYLEQAAAAGKYSIVAGELGLGRVVAFGSHPEFGFDLAMSEWAEPARMFVNAVMWQAVFREGRGAIPVSASPSRIGLPAGSALEQVQSAVNQLIDAVGELKSRSIDPVPSWLVPAYAMSVFGLSPSDIWRQSLDDLETRANEAAAIAGELGHSIGLAKVPLSQPQLEAMALINRLVLDERPPEWGQDGGYQGIRKLLRTANDMCRRALDQWNVELGPPGDPYDYFNENPYHLVAGSYLAAIGCTVGAVQLLRGLRAEWSLASQLSDAQLFAGKRA